MSEMPLEDAPGLAAIARQTADRGQVLYLTGPHGERLAAIVPPAVAAAGLAAIEALEDAEDLAAAQAALAEGGEPVSLEDLRAELGI